MATNVEARDTFIDLNGLRFHYREWGSETAPPLVLLHGVTSNAHNWDTFAASMADHFRVLALDQRGHGETQWTDGYSIDLMAGDVAAFAEALRLDRFALVGHSMGGRVAFVYADRYPQTLERLVIVDIGPSDPSTAASFDATAARISDASRASFADPEEAVRAARAANPRPSDAAIRQRVLGNLVQRDGRWVWRYDATGLAARSQQDRAPSNDDQWQILGRIPCPTLVVRGAESDTLSGAIAQRMAEVIPDCALVEVPAAGHSIPADNPDGFLGAVRPFLTRVWA